MGTGVHNAMDCEPLANTAARGCHRTVRTGPSCRETCSSAVAATGHAGSGRSAFFSHRAYTTAYILLMCEPAISRALDEAAGVLCPSPKIFQAGSHRRGAYGSSGTAWETTGNAYTRNYHPCGGVVCWNNWRKGHLRSSPGPSSLPSLTPGGFPVRS
jgi:hypothetical protein